MIQTTRNYNYNDEINGITLKPLVSLAFKKLSSNLKNYGNKLSAEHARALYEILIGFTQMAQRVTHGRIAYPLFAGGGKTQSIVAWLWAIHELGLNHVSVAVCASKVESLCDLKRDLIANGLPENQNRADSFLQL